jgi:RNA polymerase sigma-B factor
MPKRQPAPQPEEDGGEAAVVVALSEEEEHALFKAYKKDPGGETVNRILKQYENLVYHIAHKYSGGRESFDDVVQVGMMGLVNAIRRFDVGRGNRFSTFAYQTIRGEIQRYFRDKSWSMSVPRQVKELSLKVFAIEGALALKLGCSPTPAQVALEAGVTEEQVLEAMELGSAYHPLNILDETLSTGDTTLAEPGAGMKDMDSSLYWQHILSFLNEKEAEVIRLRFWDGLPQSDVAIKLSTSQMNVSRLQKQALAKLRRIMEHIDLPA